MKKTAFIIGVTGQDGALLAKFLLEKSYRVIGSTRGSASFAPNLERLQVHEQVKIVSGSGFRHIVECLDNYQPDEVYNLSGQSSVGLSFSRPLDTFESIVPITLDVLEAIKLLGIPVKFFNAGSGECFGDIGDKVATEDTCFKPASPYAIAKTTAHWQVASYRDLFGIFACTGFLYNHESCLRSDRFVTQKIVSQACKISQGESDFLTLGDLSIQRDWGWAPEYVKAMWLILQQDSPEDYILATGNSMSLKSFVTKVFDYLGLDWEKHVRQDSRFLRFSDASVHKADPGKAMRNLGWQAQYHGEDVAIKMVDAHLRKIKLPE